MLVLKNTPTTASSPAKMAGVVAACILLSNPLNPMVTGLFDLLLLLENAWPRFGIMRFTGLYGKHLQELLRVV